MDEQKHQVSGIDTTEKGEIAKMDVKQLINKISNEYFLMNFLRQHNIADVEQLQVVDHYVQGKHRAGIIIEVFERNHKGKTKILIDLKLGQPVIEQVHDALYTTGQDCDIKIIVYSDTSNIDDVGISSADEYVVLGLVSRLQEDNVPIVLFQLNEDNLEISYDDLYQDWESVDRSNTCSIPTREEFWAQTFWAVYFDSFNEGWYRADVAFEGGFRDTSEWGYLIYIDCQIYGEIQLYWDENGLRYEVVQKGGSNDLLKNAINEIMPDLQNRYGKDKVIFEHPKNGTPQLTIQYVNTPFSWLYDAALREIINFAGKVYEDAWKLRWEIEETIGKICKAKEH